MSIGRLCLYCGNRTGKVRKGDHLIPDAIGGTLATKDVCGKCNNELSDIDRELCSRSPLSLVASHAIDGHITQAWDVDAADNNLLIDGRPDAEQGFRIYPQMVITPRGEQFRADWHELREFGPDKFEVLFKRRLQKAFWNFKRGKKTFVFSAVPNNDDLLTRYTHYPRFFVRGTVAQACSDKTIELGYASRAAKRMALAKLDSGLSSNHDARTEIRLGSGEPTIRFFCDAGKVWRGLAKIAINLLHHTCRRTPVSLKTFPVVIEEILGKRKFHPNRVHRNGFVWHSDVASIAASDNSHAVRLSWERDVWTASMAFFGGRIGAAINFAGPNGESWRTLDVTAPLHSSSWAWTTSQLSIPARFHVEWDDLNLIIRGGGFSALHSAKFEV